MSPLRGRAAPAPAPEPADRGPLLTASFRLHVDQQLALQQKAMEAKIARGGRGRVDASEVLRDLIDRALGLGAYAEKGAS